LNFTLKLEHLIFKLRDSKIVEYLFHFRIFLSEWAVRHVRESTPWYCGEFSARRSQLLWLAQGVSITVSTHHINWLVS